MRGRSRARARHGTPASAHGCRESRRSCQSSFGLQSDFQFTTEALARPPQASLDGPFRDSVELTELRYLEAVVVKRFEQPRLALRETREGLAHQGRDLGGVAHGIVLDGGQYLGRGDRIERDRFTTPEVVD